MTIETRGTIELKDIKAFEFECPRCHTKILQPVREAPLRIPTACSDCKNDWIIYGSDEHERMQRFLTLLRDYATAKQSAFILRLEVAGLGESK